MEEELIGDILDLRVQGYSIRDIAAELGIKKSQVEKCLNEHREELAEMMANISDEPDSSRRPVPDDQTAEALRQLEALHAQVLKEKADQQQRLAEMERIIALAPNKEQIMDELRRKNREEKLVSRANRLIQEVLENCDDCSWSEEETDDFLERCENLKDRIKAFCDANDIDERQLHIYMAMQFLISDIEEEKQTSRSGLFGIFASGVRLYYSPEHKDTIRSYLISDFHQTAPTSGNTDTPRQALDADDIHEDDD